MEEQSDDISKISREDTKYIIKKYIHSTSLVAHLINGFNDLSNSMRNIVEHQFRIEVPPFTNERLSTEEGQKIERISFTVEFFNLQIKQPTITDMNSSKTSFKYPVEARTKMTNYTAPIFLSMKGHYIAYKFDGQVVERTETIENINLASLPIMVRSNICSTGIMKNSPEQLINVLESPEDAGGYFIMNGGEIYVVNSENIKFNSPNIYYATNPASSERIWLELISKPGDAFENSHQIIIKLGKNGSITLEIKSLIEDLNIPFYLIFRMLGITVDRDIIKYIIHSDINSNDPVVKQMQSMLEVAYSIKPQAQFQSIQNSYNRTEIILRMGEIVRELDEFGEHRNNPEVCNAIIADTMRKLDKLFLPHKGEDSSSRIDKAKYLGYLIRRLLLVDLKILQPTDRDSYTNKRVHAAGVSLAKAFKNQFNLVIVQRIKKDLKSLFSRVDFSAVHLAAININKETLEKALAQVITSSQETINIGSGVQLPNRVPSMHVHRKNQLNTIVSARNIESPVGISKQTARAEEMRHVQETTVGFICPIASKDTGEKVGMTKELPIGCTITPTQSGLSAPLKEKLLKDELVSKLSNIRPEDLTNQRLGKVFVNGDWIGTVKASHELVVKYRAFRRTSNIDMYTTIYWDQLMDEIHFWVDHGRLIRPLLIMDNNLMEVLAAEMAGKKPPPFYQKPLLTKEHIKYLKAGQRNGKDYGIDDLVRDGVMEYITPEEQLNCYIAYDIDAAYEDRHNITKAYTHIEIPQAIFGISASIGILLDHNPITRSTFETNQVKQTCGWYCLGWPWRLDANATYQLHSEHPLTRTIINDLTMPNGTNANIAYMCWNGDGQEDSAITNKSAMECGLFNCAFFRFWVSKIEPGEIIRIPSRTDTINIHAQSAYSKLNSDGFITPGAIVHNGDILISKCSTITNTTSQAGGGEKFKYIDRSIVYKHDDPAYVDKLTKPGIQTKNDGSRFVSVKTFSELPVVVGDKFSTRAGNKSINSSALWAGDMPFTATGTPITYIANPQTITTRMVVAQLIEGVLAKLCILRGAFMEVSSYTPIDLDAVRIELCKYGAHNVCKDQVYDGQTGEAIDALIVVCPAYLQRLQKFAAHEKYSNQSGPTDAITHQPTSGGRKTNGGLRVGEMEKDVISAHGSMGLMHELLFTNSDGIDIYVCRRCGNRATVGLRKGIYNCKKCGAFADIIRTSSSYAANLFMNEQNAMGIGTNLIPTPYTYYK